MPTFVKTIEILDEFAELPNGWHYGQGKPLSRKRIDAAKRIISFFERKGFTRFNAFPGLNGEIRLRIYKNDLFFELYNGIDGSIDVAIQQNGEDLVYIERATPEQTVENIVYFVTKLCPLSESSTLATSTSKSTSLQPSSLQTTTASQSSTSNALSIIARVYAATSKSSMSEFQLIPPHSTSFRLSEATA